MSVIEDECPECGAEEGIAVATECGHLGVVCSGCDTLLAVSTHPCPDVDDVVMALNAEIH